MRARKCGTARRPALHELRFCARVRVRRVRLQRPYAGEGIFSRVNYRGDGLPDGDFLRIRNGVEFTRDTGRALGGNSIAYGVFAAVDAFVDPPTGPKTGIDVPRMQFGMGIVLGAPF